MGRGWGPAWPLALSLLGTLLPALVAGQDPPLGKPAAFGQLEAGPVIFVPAGTALRVRADPESDRLATIAEDVELQILERRGDWVRTAYADFIGWLAPAGEEHSAAPIARALRAPFLTIDVSPAERAARLAVAQGILSGDTRSRSVGRWPFYTDVDDNELLRLLERVAQQVPDLYRQRFGLVVPEGASDVPVVLFSTERQYRAFTADNPNISELDGGGHADSTMAALYVDRDIPASGVAGTLIHELTHLINREVFPDAPATWLEEGLANDLGFTEIDARGNLRPGRLGGTTSVVAQRTSGRRTMVNAIQTGGVAMWTQLVRDWRSQRARLQPLDRLLDLPWVLFVDNDQRSSNYALSTFFVRYLLSDADEGRAEGFRAFLAATAQGGATGSRALAAALDTTPEELRRDFERWLTMRTLTGL